MEEKKGENEKKEKWKERGERIEKKIEYTENQRDISGRNRGIH